MLFCSAPLSSFVSGAIQVSFCDCDCVITCITAVFTAALCNRAGHYILRCFFLFYLSIYLLFSSLNLSGRKLDVIYHTSTHGVALVRIWNAGLKYGAPCARLGGNAGPKMAKNSPSGHHRTTLSGYIFATKARIDNRKKNLLNNNVDLPHTSSQYGAVGEFRAPS